MRCLETTAGLVSPSLVPASGGAAFELKFLLDDAVAAQVEQWAQARLALDPHGDPALAGAYATTSLYCDTCELDVYHRMPGYKRSKFRVRRYGSAPAAFLERKSKWGDRVQKKRSAVPDGELPLLGTPQTELTWPGHWFQRRLRLRRLIPACRISYLRTAYVGACPEGSLRLTMDRSVRGILADDWSVAPFEGGKTLLAGQVIVELKFHTALPTPFKELVKNLRLSPSIVSKYRLCREIANV